MDMKFPITIPPSLLKDIMVYCEANSITDVDKFMIKMLRQGFTTEKFGRFPQIENKEPKVISVLPNIPIEGPIEVKTVIKPLRKETKKIKDDLYDED